MLLAIIVNDEIDSVLEFDSRESAVLFTYGFDVGTGLYSGDCASCVIEGDPESDWMVGSGKLRAAFEEYRCNPK